MKSEDNPGSGKFLSSSVKRSNPPVSMLSFFQLYCCIVNGISIFCNGILLLLSAHKSIETIKEVVGSLAMTLYLYATLSFPLFFIYRTMVLANSSSYGQFFQKKNLLTIFFVVFLFSCVEGLCLFYSAIPYEDLFERLNATSKIVLEWEKSSEPTSIYTPGGAVHLLNMNYSSHSFEYSQKSSMVMFGDDYSKNPLFLFFLGTAVVSHILSYVIILIAADFMLKLLNKKRATMSRETFLSNELLVHAVFAEAFLPLLLSAPVAASAVLTFFYKDSLDWQEYLPMYCISLVPLLSPLTSFCFIKAYRDSIIYFVTLQFLKKEEAKPEVEMDDDQMAALQAALAVV